MACSLFWPFLHCHYATLITEQIEDVGFSAYDSNWFDLPMDIQKYIILIIMRSQEELYFTGLGMIYCTVETLGKVRVMKQKNKNKMCSVHTSSCAIIPFFQLWNSSFSYYMIFRELRWANLNYAEQFLCKNYYDMHLNMHWFNFNQHKIFVNDWHIFDTLTDWKTNNFSLSNQWCTRMWLHDIFATSILLNFPQDSWCQGKMRASSINLYTVWSEIDLIATVIVKNSNLLVNFWRTGDNVVVFMLFLFY